MRHSLALRREPTARQTQAISARIERELSALGARVERGHSNLVTFTMPLPWEAKRPDPMLLVTSGQVSVSAGGGGPWRVQYRVQHFRLALLCGVASLIIAAAGWSWPRLTLLQVLGVVWIVLYGAPVLVAGRRVRQLLRSAASEIVERRKTPR
jgi:hypothetical protein